tara:strand:- start:126 stop:440 length:315 start_codon:yes stop_codon:yes gene_type:complete
MGRRLDYTKEYSLKEVGKGWEDCKITYRPLTYSDLEKISDMDVEKDQAQAFQKTLSMLEDSFVGGKVRVDGETVDMENSDLRALPVHVINDFIKEATGNLDQAS